MKKCDGCTHALKGFDLIESSVKYICGINGKVKTEDDICDMDSVSVFPLERYVVIVKHQMVSGDGEIVKDLDEPLVFSHVQVLTPEYRNFPVCINEIFDRLKEEVLIRYDKKY